MDSLMFNNLVPKKSPKPKKEINKKKLVILTSVTVSVILIILIITLYVKSSHVRNFFDKYIFRKEVYENNLETISLYEGDSNYSYAFGNNIVVLSGNNLDIYNSSAKKQQTLNIEISNPIFDADNKHLVIAEKNGQKIYSIADNNILWQKNIEGNISTISVNKNGYVAVAVSNTGYKTVINTYDAGGNQLFAKHLATAYAIDVEISEDNKYLAIAESNLSGTLIQSNIEVINMDNKETYNYQAETNKMIINIEYQERNKLVCMYDDSVEIIDNNNSTEFIKYDYNNTLFLDINLSSSVARVEKTSSGSLSLNSQIKFLSTINNSTNTYEIEGIPKSIYSCHNITAVNLGTEALFIKSNGWLVKKYISTQEIQDIILNNNIVGIVYKNKIEIIKL